MLNFKIIHKIIGTLLFIEAGMMTICLGLSAYLGEDDSLAFVVSVILTILGGIIFKYAGRNGENSLGRREAYLLVTLTWIIFSFFGRDSPPRDVASLMMWKSSRMDCSSGEP